MVLRSGLVTSSGRIISSGCIEKSISVVGSRLWVAGGRLWGVGFQSEFAVYRVLHRSSQFSVLGFQSSVLFSVFYF